MNKLKLSDGSWYPYIPDLCHCKKFCGTIIYNESTYAAGHQNLGITSKRKGTHCSEKSIENIRISHMRVFLLDNLGNKIIYPPIFDLCHCNCGEIVWGGKEFINGHNSKINNSNKGKIWTEKEKEKSRIKHTKYCLYDDCGEKIIYPKIPVICYCMQPDCYEILWDGKEYVHGHYAKANPPFGINNVNYIDGRSFLPYCEKFNNKLREAVRYRDGHICQLCGKTQEDELVERHRKLCVHHIHYDKDNCYPDLITLCDGCNIKVNSNRYYWEQFFMNKLNDRYLLFWTRKVLNKT